MGSRRAVVRALFPVTLIVALMFTALLTSYPWILGAAIAKEAGVAPEPVSNREQDFKLRLLGQIGGMINDVAVQGHYAYMTVGPRLQILDIANPSTPTLVGQTPPLANAGKVAVSGAYAYLAAGRSGLLIFDVSNPASPRQVMAWPAPSSLFRIQVAGRYAYVLDQTYGLRVLDVADPMHPTEVGYHDIPGDAEGMTLAGRYAYLTDSTGYLRIVDVGNPASPSEVGSVRTYESVYGLDVAGDRIYLAAWTSGLRVVSVADPRHPVLESFSYRVPCCYATHVSVAGNYLYLGYGLALDGNRAYIAAGAYGLVIMDITSPRLPARLGYASGSNARGVAALDHYVYVAYSGGTCGSPCDGLGVYDVSNPAVPTELTRLPGYTLDVAVSGRYAYAALSNGLRVYDVSDPALPIQVDSITLPYVEHVVARNGIVYLATGANGLYIISFPPGVPYQATLPQVVK